MSNVSIWKRMGGWFRRSQQTPMGDEVILHDAEGMVLDADMNDADESPNNNLPTRKPKNQLAAMEDGFNRLVGALESLNDNVVKQCHQNEQLQEQLQYLPDLINRVPEAVDRQVELTQAIRQELQKQSDQNDRLSATLHSLPELNQAQTDRLTEIVQQLETSAETEAKMAGSMQQFDSSMQTMADNGQKLNVALFSLNDVLKQNEDRLQTLIKKQNRRFSLLILLTGLLTAAAAVAVVLILLSGKS